MERFYISVLAGNWSGWVQATGSDQSSEGCSSNDCWILWVCRATGCAIQGPAWDQHSGLSHSSVLIVFSNLFGAKFIHVQIKGEGVHKQLHGVDFLSFFLFKIILVFSVPWGFPFPSQCLATSLCCALVTWSVRSQTWNMHSIRLGQLSAMSTPKPSTVCRGSALSLLAYTS